MAAGKGRLHDQADRRLHCTAHEAAGCSSHLPAQWWCSEAASVVVLDARIGTDGSVVEARGVDPAADPDLVSAAVEAVKLWKYSPTLLNCTPIEVQMKVTVNFRTE